MNKTNNTKKRLRQLKVFLITLLVCYLVGLARGIDYATWLDLAMGVNLATLAVLVGVYE